MPRTAPKETMTLLARNAAPALLVVVLALAGCASSAPSSTPEPEASASPGVCEQVTVVVDFGPLDRPALEACAGAGVAADVLEEAGITTEGTADYGDQVVCRVNDEPAPDETVAIEGQAPFVESCASLSSAAYWGLWIKTAPDAEWEFAQEGVTTQELADGQSFGLVYTPGTESNPPRD
ncbi:hypothetical protein BH09ACT5_BH09ACT5_06540 [soil metagenome]